MRCWKCKSEMPEGLKYCGNCGVHMNRAVWFVQWLFSKKGLPVLIGVLVLALVVTGVAVWQGVGQKNQSVSETARQDPVDEVFTQLKVIEEKYADENGYVSLDDASAVLDEAYAVVSELKEVSSCERHDFSLYLILENGIGFHYHVPIQGLASSGDEIKIVTYQPYHGIFTSNSIISQYGGVGVPHNQIVDGDYPDKALKQLIALDVTDAAVETYHDQEVTIERLKLMTGNNVMVWIGHGGYSEKFHSTLCLLVEYTDELYQRYKEDFDEHRLEISAVENGVRISVTSRFFDYYLDEGELENSIIYLGTCYSGKDNVLVATLIKKGATAVYCSSEAINQRYNNRMCHSIMEAMCEGASTGEALEAARKEHGEWDDALFGLIPGDARVLCYGDENLTLEMLYEQINDNASSMIETEPTEMRETYPPAEELFNNTFWYMAYGQTLGLNYYGLFQTDGTLRVICVNGLEYPDGTYEYDPSTGRMTVYFNNWADEFQYGDGSFTSVEKYQMQVGEEYLTISPDPDGMRYFEEQPVETEPVVTEPPVTEDPVEGYYGEPLSELVGTWYAYDTVNGQDYAWCLYLGENGYGSIGMGTPNSEIDEGHEFIWGAEAEGDTYYYLMMSSQTDNWGTFLFVTRENGKLRLERNDGMSDTILASSWYERDLDYQTWLERKSQFAVEFEGHHEYVLLEAPFVEGNSMTTYLWYDMLELDTWIAEGGGGYICDLAVYWEDLYVGFDTSMFITNWGYEEDGRVFIQGTRLEDGRDIEYLIGEDGQVAMILDGDVYTGEFAGIRYGEFVSAEIASDCVYLDNRSSESERVTRYELQKYLDNEPNRNFIYITVTITVRDDGVYITQIEIPYFP